VAKDSLGIKYRNLGCMLIAIVVFLILAVSAGVVLQETYYNHPKKISEYHQAIEFQGKKLARKLTPVIEGAGPDNSSVTVTAAIAEMLANAAAAYEWCYAEIIIHESSLGLLSTPASNASEVEPEPVFAPGNLSEAVPDNSAEVYPFQTIATAGNASILPLTDREKLAAWSKLFALGPYRRVDVRNRRKILTAAVLVRKRKRERLPVHGFLIIQLDYTERLKRK
jgi:hypothetical protein